MSSEFIDVFFPLTSYLVRTRHPRTWYHFFPPELQRQCSRPLYEVTVDREGRYVVPVRWPALAPVILLGVAAMSFYAMMNISALGSHCLVSRSSPVQPLFISLDIAATACSAFSALYACVNDELSDTFQPVAAGRATRGLRKKQVVNLLLGNCILSLLAFAGLQIPFMAEMLYVGTTILAAFVVGTYLRRRRQLGRQRLWKRLTFSGGLLAISGIPLDATLCRRFGPHINHVTLLFMGCHLSMLGLLLYVREELILRYGDANATVAKAAAGGSDSGDAGLGAQEPDGAELQHLLGSEAVAAAGSSSGVLAAAGGISGAAGAGASAGNGSSGKRKNE
ncbi:hypothetical protein VOLCADRAFT_92856 [Volvox carteri f. nagariensis]|uniref:Uncharacterized protein n=1 Tax=Volvox carteri f. nagariensis TaxID=3068 RepID=D8U0N1_VOLCA|nr:uncharacterized protein VOLCADRAFT_92856 [Volvox carteri f. nagariensis]EFJ46748.1 hypothetical protein VOLCADRAFT_92856 [Volvox carteri f. nagariensis]|eukprot:XP_002952277.1 hypothetical protein VOLCADRAFT_92856 [Volvox carteri f. nagariensis]